MSTTSLTRHDLKKLVYSRLVLLVPILAAILFLPAGTLAYWEAWVYLAILLIPMVLVMRWLLRDDPALLERRMRLRERETPQKWVMGLSYLWFLGTFALPGLDRRWGWSEVPVGLVVVADLFILFGYGIFVRVLRENSYASRIIEVAEGQKVITTGPYAYVRHPLYLGVGIMYLWTPLALGSYWALLSGLGIIAVLVSRIRYEEQVLRRDLPGYEAYMDQTRYRLIPGLW